MSSILSGHPPDRQSFLAPGLANGNARIYVELGEIRKRLEVVEGKVDRVLRGV